jgi:hypothetical protein
MKLVATLLATSVAALSYAQNLSSTESLIEKEGPLTGADHIMDVKIYNLTGSDLFLNWNRSTNDMPGTWVSAICDCSLCHSTTTSSAAFSDPLQDSCFISCHIKDDGATHGVGTVTVEFYDPNDSVGTNLAITWRYSSWPLGVSVAASETIRIYPNPTASMVIVQHGADASHINLRAVDGTLIRTVSSEGAEATLLNLIGLPAGNVIVEVLSNDGTVLTTSTLTKL